MNNRKMNNVKRCIGQGWLLKRGWSSYYSLLYIMFLLHKTLIISNCKYHFRNVNTSSFHRKITILYLYAVYSSIQHEIYYISSKLLLLLPSRRMVKICNTCFKDNSKHLCASFFTVYFFTVYLILLYFFSIDIASLYSSKTICWKR